MDAYTVISKTVGRRRAATVRRGVTAEDALAMIEAALDGGWHVEVVDATGVVVSLSRLRREAAGVVD